MAKPKAQFKPGDALYIPVESSHIMESDPCNKDNCMVNRAAIAWLVEKYGGEPKRFKPKSTNHGITFELNGRKYVAVFDTKTAFRIYKYDQTFRTTHSKEKARATARPFTVRMMIESGTAVTKWPPMSPEVKAKLRKLPRKKSPHYTPKTTGARRELSL